MSLVLSFLYFFPVSLIDAPDETCLNDGQSLDLPMYDVSKIVTKSTDALCGTEKLQFLTNCWKPPHDTRSDHLHTQVFPNKKITFQLKWLDQRKWLAYSCHPEYSGGWCMICLLFLTEKEKSSLGAFVKKSFRNYNKSKEKLDGHENAAYHKKACDLMYQLQAQSAQPEKRIDAQINALAMQHVQNNKLILPLIVDAVLLCSKQQISFRGHRDDKIDFANTSTANEGNFVAIMRLLAEQNPALKEHLVSGPRNARYTSKTIQNEIIGIIADLIREYFHRCLKRSPRFALIADETTSEGREVLSVCLRLLDLENPQNPVQREVLIDLCDLARTTGAVIASTIRNSLERNKINIEHCCGQAYDTTSSMSSDKKGVQAEISKYAPDAEYQGCCLHSLNLVICHACKIQSIQNMMDSCRELYSFFDNSPKRQSFLNIVIEALSPETKKRKLKNLCKTRWVERHSTFETIFDLYEYIVVTLNEICEPTDDERFYSEDGIAEWNWDSETKTKANGLRHTMTTFGHIFNFVCAKELLEPIRPIASALQGQIVDVYFGFKKIEETISFYNEMRTNVDKWFSRLYQEVLRIATLMQCSEARPRLCSRQRNRDNTPSESVAEYWKRTVAIPFLDIVCSEIQSRFSIEKRAHYELCALIPSVITAKTSEEIAELTKVLKDKWDHLLPTPSAFEMEMSRWAHHCNHVKEEKSVRSLLSLHADATFFPNIRELLKILAVLPMGSTEAERSFSCVRRVHTWLRSTMSTERLSDLAVIAMHGHTIPINRENICKAFIEKHPRKMMEASLFSI